MNINMNIFKKLFSNKLIMVIVIILLFIVYLSFSSTNILYYNIEGLTASSNPLTCVPKTSTRCPKGDQGKDYTLHIGTCAETYGPKSANHDPNMMLRCVDKPPASATTPAIGAHTETTHTFCTNINKQTSKYKNIMAYYDCQ